MASDVSGVFVPIERLKLLEKYEAEHLELEKKKKDKLAALKEAEKANPEKHAKKVLENYHKNKDEINAKKRAQYAAKKAAAAAAAESKNAIV
jgi:hypothetical protein